MRGSSRCLSKVLDIPQGLSARLPVRKKKLLRMSQQRGMLENELILGERLLVGRVIVTRTLTAAVQGRMRLRRLRR